MQLFPVQKLIFDLDGTLIDTAADLHAATNHVLITIGRPAIPLETVRPHVGFGALRMIEAGLNATGGLQGHNVREYRDIFLNYYRENIAVHSRVFDGGLDLLEKLQNTDVEVAICTNKAFELATELIKSLKIDHLITYMAGGNTFPFNKPDPRHILETAAALKGNGPIVMVGDSSPDIKAAKAANIPVIAASYGYADMPIESLAPDAFMESLADLEGLLSF